jgi:hypothetical protein
MLGVECVVYSPPGRDPALLLKRKGAQMFSVDLSTREWDGHVVVALSGELDLVDAADVGLRSMTSPCMPAWKGQPLAPDAPGGWSCHCGGSTGRAGRILSCSQGRHPQERSAVAHGSRPERQERHSLTAASRSR